MNDSNLHALKENYADMIVDGMDMRTLVSFAIDSIMGNLEDYDEQMLEEEITDLYGEETFQDLLPSDTVQVSNGSTLQEASWALSILGLKH